MIDLTILIISYKSLKKLIECIQTIGKNKKILVVENSNNIQIKNELEKKYPNCEVYLNNSNLGYSKASNIGFRKIKTDYALLLNTDIKISEEQINEIEKEVKNIGTRFILGSPLSDDLVDFNKNNKLDKYFDEESLDLNSTNNSTKVDLKLVTIP